MMQQEIFTVYQLQQVIVWAIIWYAETFVLWLRYTTYSD